MTDRVDTLAALHAVIGKTPAAIALKVIDHLDPLALNWLSVSPLMFAGIGGDGAVAITMGGGAAGFATGDRDRLLVPLAALDRPEVMLPGLGFGSLFLAPGIGETLRVNGRVEQVADGLATIRVEECYAHCAKALIRSDFWTAEATGDVPSDTPGFIAASRFMALATIDADGHADVSPKGDPAGCMARLDGDLLRFADRPGNRRVDSFRNIIAQPRIAAVLLAPGSGRVAYVDGTARLTADERSRADFAVRGKVPLLVANIEDAAVELCDSPALTRASLWPVRDPVGSVEPARMFVAHVKLNKDKGLAAALVGHVLSVPSLMQRSLDSDYRKNLY